ncbi:glycoside hydrolase family 5 protein [Sphingomonas sp. ASV193]|uniref:glycoside hydrolase family 5 protein n=1 Tax=Sphingomonas sp. ASV193 TaxID=3144405 RepID=UPI0032E8D906
MRRSIVNRLWVALAAAAALLPAVPAAAAPASFSRGVNVLGYDPYWDEGGTPRFQWRHFAAIRRAGFDHVRVNLQAFRHMDAKGQLSADWLRKLDRVVAEARKAGLSVILDEHDFNRCSDDIEQCRAQLTSFWAQVAPRYRRQPASVAFELLNEPHDKLNGEPWNALLADALAVVRKTNPTRTVIVGPTHWNSLADLDLLRLPERDRHLMVTFHYYEPFRFTHQGAGWTDLKTLRGVTWGSAEDRAVVSRDFDKVAAWAKAHGRSIYLGEFGAYDGSGTPTDLRVAYTATVARAAEAHRFGWAYWQFDGDFIVWDMKQDGWVVPIRDALLPPR